ncbi:SDR family oxidoreductase [Rothia uropygioeca]|uniref:SDR family oxidoreductase n=1 Tax=Kocuria sp. 257 TaxID=2021970 RepID=UPI00192DD3E1|nr:SDR family oxidoreductase [Kocuria sp. 257]
MSESPRVIVITGASRGIGRLLAQRLGSQGAHLVINYKANSELAEESLAAVREAGGGGITVQADVESPEGVDELFAAVDAAYDHVDAFVANAAASAFKPVKDLKVHHLDRSYAMNVRSFVLGAQRAAERMRDGGKIVYMSSYGSHSAFPTYAALGAAKAMGEQYMRYMAVEFGPRNITVNAVNGGLIDTDSLDFFYNKVPGMADIDSVVEKLPLGRPATAEDMAQAALFLLSEQAGYITGQVLNVDGGLSVIAPPYWADTKEPLREAVFGQE